MQTESRGPLRLVAHRGWPERFPENSLMSFAAAIGARADEIELDAWCTSDGVPFVCHDATLERVSDLTGAHSERTMAELREAAIKMPDGSLLPGVGFPTLEEALCLCAGRVTLNLHLKDTGPDDRILCFLRGFYAGSRPACGSYIAGDRRVLSAARRVCPEIPRCCLEAQHSGAEMLKAALELECERVQFGRGTFTQQDIDQALAAGIVTNLFWSDSAAEIAEFFGNGILAPLTNDIGVVRPELKRRQLVR